jgi:hypothetical protein
LTNPRKGNSSISCRTTFSAEIETLSNLISLPYTTCIGHEAWKQEIVNWIPKENNNPDINKRRPLMYYEVN